MDVLLIAVCKIDSYDCCCVISIAKMKQYNEMIPTTACVLRNGRVIVIDAIDLVVGDIVLIIVYLINRYF